MVLRHSTPPGRLVAAGAVLREDPAAGAGAWGSPGEGADLGVVDEAVDHGGGDVLGGGLAPAGGVQARRSGARAAEPSAPPVSARSRMRQAGAMPPLADLSRAVLLGAASGA